MRRGRGKSIDYCRREWGRVPIPLRQILFSGCKDSQTSADVQVENGLAAGAMSHAFMKCLGAFPARLHFQGTGELSLWQRRTQNNLIGSC